MTCGVTIPPVKLLVDDQHYLLLDGTVTQSYKLDIDTAGNNLDIDGGTQSFKLDIDTAGNNLDIDALGNDMLVNSNTTAGAGFDLVINTGGLGAGSGFDLLISNGISVPFTPIATLYGDYFKPDAQAPVQ